MGPCQTVCIVGWVGLPMGMSGQVAAVQTAGALLLHDAMKPVSRLVHCLPLPKWAARKTGRPIVLVLCFHA